jgi:hypothetical protein
MRMKQPDRALRQIALEMRRASDLDAQEAVNVIDGLRVLEKSAVEYRAKLESTTSND